MTLPVLFLLDGQFCDRNKVIMSTQETDEIFITKKQCADLLKVSVPTIDLWRARGIIPFYRIGARVLFKREEIINEVLATRRD